ncbi:hypothetical protein [Flavobacterium beibuense]|uniref:hypothetical protein n=1 Tax=Flavobacterium beibuense TaxID=657326 RepID=UPI001E5BFEBD|nr:hypothetical protein [Flavobacterium beibuense]
MKKLVIICSMVIFFKPLIPVFEYVLNYDYIANELCENKAKPELHCNGKCHLMKELAKAAEDEKPVSNKKTSHQETEVLFFQDSFDFTFNTVVLQPIEKVAIPYTNLYSHNNTGTVFHPPTFIG